MKGRNSKNPPSTGKQAVSGEGLAGVGFEVSLKGEGEIFVRKANQGFSDPGLKLPGVR